MIAGFDWDGTLVTSFAAAPLPGAAKRLAALEPTTKTFIASNQAGPVFRAVLRDPKYPTVEQVALNFAGGLAALHWTPDLLMICVAPGKDGDGWARAAEDVRIALYDTLRAAIGAQLRFWTVYHTPTYRKPAPGMLCDAQELFHSAATIAPEPMIYIGDLESDRQAAAAAHARFVDAAAWREGAAL